VGTGASLAAPYLPLLPTPWVITNITIPFFQRWYLIPVSELSDIPYSWFWAARATPHFPYGLIVPPDVPL